MSQNWESIWLRYKLDSLKAQWFSSYSKLAILPYTFLAGFLWWSTCYIVFKRKEKSDFFVFNVFKIRFSLIMIIFHYRCIVRSLYFFLNQDFLLCNFYGNELIINQKFSSGCTQKDQKFGCLNKRFRLNMDQWKFCLNYQKNIVDFFALPKKKKISLVSKKMEL